MKELKIPNDILLICKEAKNFPNGVSETFKALENDLTSIKERKCYGIYKEKGKTINYRAAFSTLAIDNLSNYPDTFTINKGNYLSLTITDWFKKIESIGPTFCELLKDPRVDSNCASIEVYEGNNLICMLKMKG